MSGSNGDKPKMTAAQQKAVQFLLTEKTIKDAAAKAGVGESTLRRWIVEPTFAATYKAALAHVYEGGLSLLQSSIESGVKTLREICEDAAAPHQVRVSAAKSLVEFSLKARDQSDTQERLKAVEEYIDLKKRGQQ
jgi:hypothetical protein